MSRLMGVDIWVNSVGVNSVVNNDLINRQKKRRKELILYRVIQTRKYIYTQTTHTYFNEFCQF